jgi:hypothetical protein
MKNHINFQVNDSRSTGIADIRTYSKWWHSAVLYFIFMSICFGLGYAAINRYDPRTTGISDTSAYHNMTQFNYDPQETLPPWRFRPLIPTLAGGLLKIVSQFNLHSWNPVFFCLLIVNSFFVSFTCLMLIEITRSLKLGNAAALLSPFLYLSSYSMVNYHMAGLVESGEAFFITAIILALLKEKWFLIPVLFGIGAFAKEGVVVFGLAYAVGWWLFQCFTKNPRCRSLPVYIIIAAIVGAITIQAIRSIIGGPLFERHAPSLNRLLRIPHFLFRPVYINIKDLLYALSYLLPVGLIGLKKIPLGFVVASLVSGLTVVMAGAYSEAVVGRALFDTIGPLLTISCSTLLCNMLGNSSQPTGL